MKFISFIGQITNLLGRELIGSSRPTRVEFVPMCDLMLPTARANRWRSTGDDPIFHLRLGPSIDKYTGRWVRIQSDILPIAKTSLAPKFYFGNSNEYSESRSIKLRVGNSGIDEIIYIPYDTVSIRFDPLSSTGEFQIEYIKFIVEPFFKGIKNNYNNILMLYGDEKRNFKTVCRDAVRVFKDGSVKETWDWFVAAGRPIDTPASYYAWIEAVENAEKLSVAAMQAEIASFAFTPLISIIMPVYNTPRRWLEEAIRSIKGQTYKNWELCICDDNSSEVHIWPMLTKFAAKDARIKLHRRKQNGRISVASNDAMTLATGAYITLMDHDDVIPNNALYEFAKVLNADRTADFIYSDEDKLSMSGVRYEPFFKPDWSPETLEACMYTSHLALYRMDVVGKVGGFRNECNGAQDYDFVLRYTEHARNVVHIPKVLYHWRAIPGSTAVQIDNKDYVIGAALRALGDRARRTGDLDFARSGPYVGCFELRRRLTATPLVSIVISSADRDSEIDGPQIDRLAACINSIHEISTYKNIEIVVVDNGYLRSKTLAVLDRVGAHRITYNDSVFNIAKKMNIGAHIANGKILVFLDSNTELISPDWIEAMLAIIQRPGVGVVSPKLLSGNGEIQHAGVTFSHGMPDYIRRGYPRNDAGYFFSTTANHNYLAVTGTCMMLDRAVFEQVGRFDESLAVNYSDIDLCLRIHKKGMRIVYCAQTILYYYDNHLKKIQLSQKYEIEYFKSRWSEMVEIDPYYSTWFQHHPSNYVLDPARF